MIKTTILTDAEPLETILAGAEKLYKAVSTTMGPRGSNVLIRKAGGRSFVTHDGVTVAKSVKLENPAEDIAADLMREAASKLDVMTGDGTTTVTVLAYHLLRAAAELVRGGANPMKVKLGLEALEPRILNEIREVSKEIVTEQELINVATVSSGSKEIGAEVGKALFEAGKDTPIVLGFSNSTETTSEVITGIKLDAGPASPYLMDNAGLKTEIPTPYIIVVDGKLRAKDDVLPILKLVASLPAEQRSFLLVASEVAGDALQLLVMNRLKGFCNLGVVRVPANIGSHSEYLADVAAATGATVLTKNTGNPYSDPREHHFGKADSVAITMTQTVIANGQSISEDLQHHINALTSMAKSTKDVLVKEFLEQRLKFLSQKVVSIYVGGQSESESEEKHFRYEDAVGACQAALRHGYVPGGGTVLYSIGRGLEGESYGTVMAEALQAPLELVLGNAGIEVTDSLQIDPGWGHDVMHPEDGFIDLAQRGIIDPTESELEAVKTAITIAGLLLTSGAVIVDEVIEEPKHEAQL